VSSATSRTHSSNPLCRVGAVSSPVTAVAVMSTPLRSSLTRRMRQRRATGQVAWG
jgi:hypothetical protein